MEWKCCFFSLSRCDPMSDRFFGVSLRDRAPINCIRSRNVGVGGLALILFRRSSKNVVSARGSRDMRAE